MCRNLSASATPPSSVRFHSPAEKTRQRNLETLKKFSTHRCLPSPHFHLHISPMAPTSGIYSRSECSQPMGVLAVDAAELSSVCSLVKPSDLQAHRELGFPALAFHRCTQIGLPNILRRRRKGAHKSCLMGVRNLRTKIRFWRGKSRLKMGIDRVA